MNDFELVRQLFDYDQNTGILTWKVRKQGHITPGVRAGHDHRARGHRVVEFNGKKYKEHRVIWLWWHGAWPTNQIDHINRVKSDNRLCNLRIAERGSADNAQNIGITKRNTSGVVGVSFTPRNSHNKWRAYIRIAGKTQMLGSFPTKEAAADARLTAELKHYTFKHQLEKS